MVYFYLKHFSANENFQQHFVTNGGDSLGRLNDIPNLNYSILKFSTGYENIFYKRNFYKNLKDYILQNKINLIHTHHRFPENVSARIAKELNIKTVTSAHSFVKGFKRSSFKSHIIISVSDSISRHLINDFNIEKENIISIYNPVEKVAQIDIRMAEQFKRENNISPDEKLLLFVGRISKDKGIDTLLKSFTLIREEIKNVTLVINGQVEDKKLKQNFNENKIIYVSPQKDTHHLYYVADIVVLPSRTDPFPFVMLEAGSFKKPFIGGNTGGIAEFIEDGKNGLLISPENSEELAEKIIYLMDNQDIGKKLGENLHNKVSSLCDFNNYFTKVENIYNSLLSS